MFRIAQFLDAREVRYLQGIGDLRQPVHNRGNIDGALTWI